MQKEEPSDAVVASMANLMRGFALDLRSNILEVGSERERL
jgi:hypothetical protein